MTNTTQPIIINNFSQASDNDAAYDPLLTQLDRVLPSPNEDTLRQDVNFRRRFETKTRDKKDISEEFSYFHNRLTLDHDIGAGQLLWHACLREGHRMHTLLYLAATATLGDKIAENALVNTLVLDTSLTKHEKTTVIAHLTRYSKQDFDTALDILTNLVFSSVSKELAKEIVNCYARKGGDFNQYLSFVDTIDNHEFDPLELNQTNGRRVYA